MIRRPERAARLPLELIDAEDSAGGLLLEIAGRVDSGDMPSGNTGLLLETYRGSTWEGLVSAIVAELDERGDEGLEENEFVGILDLLHQRSLQHDIDALNEKARNGGLGGEERQRYAELLKRLSELQKHRPKPLIGKESM